MTPELRAEIEHCIAHPDMLHPAAQLREWLAEALREIDRRQPCEYVIGREPEAA